MIRQFLCAFGLTLVTVIIHGLATLEALAHMARVRRRKGEEPGLLAQVLLVVRTVAILLVLHLIEAGVWAGFYVVADAMPDLETAIYFSMTSYTTVGYGDVLLPADWRLLGPSEAAVGILMFGWSTAIIVGAITRIYGDRFRALSQNDQSTSSGD
jgi:voltage-gated potassium channel